MVVLQGDVARLHFLYIAQLVLPNKLKQNSNLEMIRTQNTLYPN